MIGTIGSLFSGVGGLELGLEWSGWGPTVWQVEQSPFCRGVLARHWPDAERYEDVCDVGAANLKSVDIICGGFPCTGLSDARRQGDRRPGLEHGASGLWSEFARVIHERRPRAVVVENVDGGARRHWLPEVRGTLHNLGYSGLPVRVRAADVGAPHLGSRVFVVATPHGKGQPTRSEHEQVAILRRAAEACRRSWGFPSSTSLGVADGIPGRLDRVRSCGRAVVPQCAQVVGEILKELIR